MGNARKYFYSALAGLALGVFMLSRCGRSKPVVTTPLQPNESAKVTVQDRTLLVQSKDGLKTAYVPEGGSATVTVKKNGDVRVVVKNKGWGGGLGGGISYGDSARVTLDKQLGFFNRASLHAGLGFGRTPIVQPFLAGGYRLDRFRYTQNTSLTVGKAINSKFLSTADGWLVGIRWSF